MDRNGYNPSLLDTEQGTCYLCHTNGQTVRHEIYMGTGERSLSKRFGLWVNLCPRCHMQIHDHPDRSLKVAGQIRSMAEYGWTVEEFRERFGKSYV